MPRTDPRSASTRSRAALPAAMFSKDHHSLWLNSAALELAAGDLEVEGGVVERDGAGSPTGVLREEAAWRFRDRHLAVSRSETLAAMRDGLAVAAARGVTGVHDKDGGLGALGLWQSLEARGRSRSGSGSRSRPRSSISSRRSGSAPASGAPGSRSGT